MTYLVWCPCRNLRLASRATFQVLLAQPLEIAIEN
jgi:hypothetical protein